MLLFYLQPCPIPLLRSLKKNTLINLPISVESTLQALDLQTLGHSLYLVHPLHSSDMTMEEKKRSLHFLLPCIQY